MEAKNRQAITSCEKFLYKSPPQKAA